MSDIYIDWETIPSQNEEVVEAIAADIEAECEAVTAPGNYKKPETHRGIHRRGARKDPRHGR